MQLSRDLVRGIKERHAFVGRADEPVVALLQGPDLEGLDKTLQNICLAGGGLVWLVQQRKLRLAEERIESTDETTRQFISKTNAEIGKLNEELTSQQRQIDQRNEELAEEKNSLEECLIFVEGSHYLPGRVVRDLIGNNLAWPTPEKRKWMMTMFEQEEEVAVVSGKPEGRQPDLFQPEGGKSEEPKTEAPKPEETGPPARAAVVNKEVLLKLAREVPPSHWAEIGLMFGA